MGPGDMLVGLREMLEAKIAVEGFVLIDYAE